MKFDLYRYIYINFFKKKQIPYKVDDSEKARMKDGIVPVS